MKFEDWKIHENRNLENFRKTLLNLDEHDVFHLCANYEANLTISKSSKISKFWEKDEGKDNANDDDRNPLNR